MNNAGFVLGVDRIGSLKEDEIDAMFATNVKGLIDMTQLLVNGIDIYRSKYFLRLPDADFKERQSGHIINIGSIAGREAYPGGSIYCATKFAVNAFTTALRGELVNTPIRVTEIQPGKYLLARMTWMSHLFYSGMVETGSLISWRNRFVMNSFCENSQSSGSTAIKARLTRCIMVWNPVSTHF